MESIMIFYKLTFLQHSYDLWDELTEGLNDKIKSDNY